MGSFGNIVTNLVAQAGRKRTRQPQQVNPADQAEQAISQGVQLGLHVDDFKKGATIGHVDAGLTEVYVVRKPPVLQQEIGRTAIYRVVVDVYHKNGEDYQLTRVNAPKAFGFDRQSGENPALELRNSERLDLRI